jgi:hypothetical protein
MPSPPEWINLPTAKFRLLELAVYDRTDNAAACFVADLADELLAAHIMDWYGGALPADTQGIAVVEWSKLLKDVQAFQPTFWPPEPTEAKPAAKTNSAEPAPAAAAARPRGTQPVERNRVKKAMLDDIKEGRRTAIELNTMKREALAETYKTKSRSTAVAALVEAMSELTPTKVRQSPTNSDTN